MTEFTKADRAVSQEALRDRAKANVIGVQGALGGVGAAYIGGSMAHSAHKHSLKPGISPENVAHAKKWVKISSAGAAAGVAGAAAGTAYAVKRYKSANRKQRKMNAGIAAMRQSLDYEPTGPVAKRDAFGVELAKSDRHMGSETAQWAGKMPKHSDGAAFLRDAAKGPKPKLLPIVRTVVAKADELPGDNRQAQMARTRRKAGLGVAGGGYLMTSRSKDVAHPIADWSVPKGEKTGDTRRMAMTARKAGEGKRLATVARRTKLIHTATTRAGLVAIGSGLALSGEGALADLHHRQAASRAHANVREAMGRPADTPVFSKGWGSLASGAMKAFKPVGAKLGAGMEGPVGPSLVARLKPLAPQLSQNIAPVKAKIAAGGLKPFANGKLTTAGVGYAAGAGGLGAGLALRGGNNNVNKSVQGRVRTAVLEKAYDSERSRHNRQAAYTGGLAGGAVVAGAAGVHTGRDAKKLGHLAGTQATVAGNAQKDVQRRLVGLSRPGTPPAAPPPTPAGSGAAHTKAVNDRATAHRTTLRQFEQGSAIAHQKEAGSIQAAHASALHHETKAVELAGKAKKLTRISRGSLIGAGALGLGAAAVHRYDRHQGGRSTGDYGY